MLKVIVASRAHEIAEPAQAFSSHVWRNAAAGNFGGWQVARALQFLVVLVGAVGTARRHRAKRRQ